MGSFVKASLSPTKPARRSPFKQKEKPKKKIPPVWPLVTCFVWGFVTVLYRIPVLHYAVQNQLKVAFDPEVETNLTQPTKLPTSHHHKNNNHNSIINNHKKDWRSSVTEKEIFDRLVAQEEKEKEDKKNKSKTKTKNENETKKETAYSVLRRSETTQLAAKNSNDKSQTGNTFWKNKVSGGLPTSSQTNEVSGGAGTGGLPTSSETNDDPPSSSPVNYKFVKVYKDKELQSRVHIPVIGRSGPEHARHQRNKLKWCFQPIAPDLESPKLVIADKDFAEEAPEETFELHSFDYVRQNYEELEVQMAQDYALLSNITSDKLSFQRVESPVVHNAAVCQLYYKSTEKLKHFAHTMEEIYKCFGYWIDSGCGQHHGTDKTGITPVLLYDKASQERYLMGEAFATNPFMMGIREFLETELGLVLMSMDEYYGCHLRALHIKNTTASNTVDCQKVYHPDQTIRTLLRLGERGYYFRHSAEWNRHMDSYLRKKKVVKEEPEATVAPTTSGTEKDEGKEDGGDEDEDSEATEASLEEKEGMPKEELPKTGKTLAPTSSGTEASEDEDEDQDSDATESIDTAHASEEKEEMSGEMENNGSDEAFGDENDSNGLAETNGDEISLGDANQEKVAVSGMRRRLTSQEKGGKPKKKEKPLQFPTCVKPPRIGILNRRNTRTILNSDGLAKELSKLVYVYERNTTATPLEVRSEVPVSVAYFEDKTFLEQVEFFRQTDILISGHGAQLTGLPFMANDVSESRAKSCKYVMELYPKKYGLPYYFGTLAVQSLIGHSYVYYDDGLPQFEAGKPPKRNRKIQRQPLQVLKPWERANSQIKRERMQSRNSLFCPRPENMVEYVSRLVHEWYKCHGCGM